MVNSIHKRSVVPLNSRIILINHKPVISREKTITEATHFNQNRIKTTKYTLINFVPKNLFQQFRRIGNLYFLFTTLIQIFTNSPVSPATSLVPLLFVVLTTSIKQAYEDWLRHKNDRIVNNKLISKVEDEQEIPCDLILLGSSQADGTCSVTTANLDGETNLKRKVCVPLTKSLRTPDEMAHINGYIECEEPNADLYEFSGLISIKFTNSIATVPLSLENILLRGSRLMNTNRIYGVACYTGDDTKMSLNSKINLNKFSSIERSLNYYLISFLILLFIFSITLSILRYWILFNDKSPWYLQNVNPDAGRELFLDTIINNFLEFFVLLNYLIPMSLYVCLELVRFFGVKLLLNDKHLVGDFKDPKTFPVCNCSDLNEELGQVTHLLTDKTGTLTENKMRFVACSVKGQIYEDRENELYQIQINNEHNRVVHFTQELSDFFLCLAICNTVSVKRKKRTKSWQELAKARLTNVQVSSVNSLTSLYDSCDLDKNESLEYSADSPDELALVQAASRYNVQLIHSNHNRLKINVHGQTMTYKQLLVLPFDSNRKRMSVLVRDDQNRIMLYSKGAENVIYNRLADQPEAQMTLKQIDYFARLGLRTMMLACKCLTEQQYTIINDRMKEASNSLSNQQMLIQQIYDELERDLQLLGATAVEDRLQEDVARTISDLRFAGISIWLLTGDKLETALAVACASRLIEQHMHVLTLSRQLDEKTCGQQLLIHLKRIMSVYTSIRRPNRFWSLFKSKKESINAQSVCDQSVDHELNVSEHLVQTSTNSTDGKLSNKPIETPNNANSEVTPKSNSLDKSTQSEDPDELMQVSYVHRLKSDAWKTPFNKEVNQLLSVCRQTKNHGRNQERNKYALLVDGRSLHIALKFHRNLFQMLAQKSSVIVCGRMSPIQKAQMVKLVKNFDNHSITAAIGDGANDISMIQEANVGFGIMGQEGIQAVRSSDFAFSKFKFIRRILLVHGHLFYVRITNLIHYYFYKSLVFVIPQLLYAKYNMYSAQTLYHGMILMMFNLLFSSTPVFIFSLFDKYIPASVLSSFPLLFKTISKNHCMKGLMLYKWISIGLIQGLIIFYSIYNLTPSTVSILSSGQPLGMYSFGLIIAHVVVIVVNIKVAIMSRKIIKYLAFSLISTVVAMPIFCYIYSKHKWNLIDDTMYGQFNNLIWAPTFWLILLLVSFLAIMPDLIYSVSEISVRLYRLSRIAKQQSKHNNYLHLK